MNSEKLLEMEGISKRFSGIQALSNAKFELLKGEIHALMGANGAGKSTLIKILCGVHQSDSGSFKISGQQVLIRNPFEAQKHGIAYVPQEIAVQPYMTVAENIFLGRHPIKNHLIDFKTMEDLSREILDDLGINIEVDKLGIDLSIAEKQLITIAKVISGNSKVLIFDEATSALTMSDTEKLFRIIRRLKAKGIGVIYVTHRMEEIFQICDRVTVFKDGEFVIDSQIEDIDMKQLIKFMIGKEVSTEIRTDQSALKTEILAIKNLNVDGILNDISLTLNSGEILGLAGLVGSGRTELLRAIFGDLKISQGSILVDGKMIPIGSCKVAIDEGIGLVPEDRKSQGLILNFSLRSNICMAVLGRLKKFGFISTKQENSVTQDLLNKLNVRHNSLNQKVNTLSGGNQQRVVLGKWLATRPKILLIDEPTRGVDVSAKAEIHKVLKELAKNGMGIIVVSSELSELLQITERILVICRGQLVANVETKSTNTQELMELSTGEKLTHMDKS